MTQPSPELLESLYAGKRELHAKHRALALREKVRHVIELQKIDYELRKQRGDDLKPWQKPWDVEP